MKKATLGALSAVALGALVLTGCSTGEAAKTTPEPTGNEEAPKVEAQDITFWVMGGDTPGELRDYLVEEYAAQNGGVLTIEEQGWGDAVAKLTTALPDSDNTPDVTEIGNTWASTFAGVGAFADISDLYGELGGDNLLQSFVEAGSMDGVKYALPYYFGSRYLFFRKDIYEAAGLEVPTTLSEFSETAAALKTDSRSGFYIGGSDWRNGVSWIFANGGDLAKQDGDKWVSTLSDPNTLKGLEMLQELYQSASLAPVTEFDSTPWVNINDNDATGAPEAATIIGPGWARWSIGDAVTKEDGTEVREWNDDVFGVFVLPGVDGGVAPVFAGGSNIAISAASKNQEGARTLLRIIFSEEYQRMLGENGLGPANMQYVDSMGDDQFSKALIESAAASKLTPAAPGWAAVEGSGLLEELFGKINGGGNVAELAAEYDAKITPLLNN